VIRTTTRFACALALTLFIAPAGLAQAQDDDAVLKPAEPDYTLINLPTSLRLPPMKDAVRMTHRFVRSLKCDTCPNSLVGDAFGIDNGALIGLEWRMGLFPNMQIVAHRARPDKAVQFLGEYGLTRQRDSMPLEIAALASVEGTENFTGIYSPALGLAITRLIGDQAAIHVDPIWVNKSDLENDNTVMIGLGTRVQIVRSLYLTGEITPRLSGNKPGTSLIAVAIEKRLGGHMFQLNFSNSASSTTLRQIAQGAVANDLNHWYMGFNITRKFF
jgi:hypothetical protein